MDKQHIDQIFNKTTMLVIPFYQRSYVWKKDNWDRMLEDLKQTCDNDTNYFMGTCI